MEAIGFISITLILFMCFNGLVIRWNNESNINLKLMWSKWWHKCALVIRVSLWLAIWMITLNWIPTLIIVFIDCSLYPIIINLINNYKWYYIGTTSKIDILIRRLFLWVKTKLK